MTKSAEMRLVEMQLGQEVRDALFRELSAGKSYKEIGRAWGVHELTILAWVRRFGFTRRWVQNSPIVAK